MFPELKIIFHNQFFRFGITFLMILYKI